MKFTLRNLTILICALGFLSFCSVTPSLAESTSNGAAVSEEDFPWIPLREVREGELNRYVYTKGRVVSILMPEEGTSQPIKIFLQDGTDVIVVVIFQETWRGFAEREEIMPQMHLWVYGKTSEYRGARQLEVEQPNFLMIAPNSPRGARLAAQNQAQGPIEVSIGAITLATIGRDVTIQGRVREYVPSTRPRVPSRVVVEDDTGEIEVVYWAEVSENLQSEHAPAVGSMIRISGRVGEFRESLQLRVSSPSHISRAVLTTAESRNRASERRPDQTP